MFYGSNHVNYHHDGYNNGYVVVSSNNDDVGEYNYNINPSSDDNYNNNRNYDDNYTALLLCDHSPGPLQCIWGLHLGEQGSRKSLLLQRFLSCDVRRLSV
jgi:hypothetical protein